MFVEFTNLYAVQTHVNNFPPTCAEEIRNFIGIHILMGCLSYPRVSLYWEPKFCIPLIAENMTLKRFFKLRTNFHVVDNNKHDSNDKDRFWKVRPIYNCFRNRCKELVLEPKLCIDEQIIPFKGQISAKVFMQNKPSRWGIKSFMLFGESGLEYDFLLYQGSTTEVNDQYTEFGKTESIVMHLCDRIDVQNICLFFDNYFTTFRLLEWLRNKQIYAVGTIRENRFSKPPFLADKEIRKNYERVSNFNKVVRWFFSYNGV